MPRHRRGQQYPLYRVRRTLRTRLALLTDTQRARVEAVFAADEHVAVEVTWWWIVMSPREDSAVRVDAGGSGGAGNDRVFRERAVVVLTADLVAAAVSGGNADDIRAWSTDPRSQATTAAARVGGCPPTRGR